MSPRIVLAAAVLSAAALVPAAAPAASNQWREPRPLVIAHQGGEDELPSNTMYAFKEAMKAGAQMLELDIGVSRDGHVIVIHDTTVDRVTNGTGTIESKTLRQLKALDAAYWFSPVAGDGNAYDHGKPASAYRFRGVATGKKRAPKGYARKDFQLTTLREVLRAFPRTPINIEIKGRTKTEAVSEYLANARALARELKGVKRRDLIVVSFKQEAVDLFHQLRPELDVAPGVNGMADYLLGGKSPGDGVKAFQVPITYVFGGTLLTVTQKDFVDKAHGDGYAWHVWFGNGDRDVPATWRMLAGLCVDGIMTARPKALAREFRARPPRACKV